MTARWKINKSKRRPGWLVVIGPKDDGFIAAIKVRIPSRQRTYDPKIIAWLVHEDARAELEQLIEEHSS